MNSPTISYTCSGVQLLGGYNVLSGQYSWFTTNGQNFYRVYSGILSHNVVYFTFTLYELDSLDNDDYFQVIIDSNPINGWSQSYSQWNTDDICGNAGSWNHPDGYPDLPNVRVFGRSPHTSSTLTLKLGTKNDGLSSDESYGYRDISLQFITTSNASLKTNYICGRHPTVTLPSQCPCPQGKYADSNGICKSCSSSCSSCFGPSAQECFQCASGAGTNGTACFLCDPSCSTCTSGSAANQCSACPAGNALFNSQYCASQSSCVSPLPLTYDSYKNAICTSPCSSSQYVYWDSSCSSNCDSPLTPINVTPFLKTCTYTCSALQFLYWDGSCQSTCVSPLQQNTTKAKQFCLYPCASNQYLYWNGTCVSTCAAPLVQRTANNRSFCDYPCTTAQFLYWNGTCTESCNSPFTSRVEANRNYCDYPCASTQYLYWDKSCQSSCSSPLTISKL